MGDLTENNRKHFDKVASNHQADFGDLIQTAIRELEARRHWISSRWTDTDTDSQIRLLDYACGAGTVSKALAPYVTQAIGLDLSENMVAEYNKAALEVGYTAERMQAYQFDLLAGDSSARDSLPPGILSPSSFDVIIICLALHHVADPARLLGRFAGLLNPGGVCVVLDMARTETDDLPDLERDLEPEHLGVMDTIKQHGFTGEEIRALYEGIGMWRGFDHKVIEEKFRFTMFGKRFSYTAFLARGEVS
ncbi:S-adenosyl-L-methionine-dependent methyltransferase [Aspergillus californicus]